MKAILKQKGFTLIELLIVFAVMGVLSAIAIPSYFDYIKSARKTTDIAYVSAVANNAHIYFAENGYYGSQSGCGFNLPDSARIKFGCVTFGDDSFVIFANTIENNVIIIVGFNGLTTKVINS